ncbi:TetR family transcriptional regulator [Luteibacter rhizovicinus DSM 16549]|uniref:TetR family transcriptional regulator n=2 Tax=Luteibacter rhizovicinus TaxID=242606 RepID=A0A1L3ERK7_9GAMM|nr:TetR family transcriptional regulator [Luteibacter rhizovicinus DSM 16549]
MHGGTKMETNEKRPRGRPRAYEPDVALRRAADAFWKTGYAGTSLDDLSAATGMNRPSLRAAFGDKHTIYIRALEDYWGLKFATMGVALSSAGALPEVLMRVYDAALDIYFSGDEHVRGCFVVGTAITEALGDPEIQDIVTRGFRKLDADFETRLREARDAGELKKDADVEALAMLVSATMHTIAMRARAGAPRDELRKLAVKAVGVICG